jgi:hypothetical protein
MEEMPMTRGRWLPVLIIVPLLLIGASAAQHDDELTALEAADALKRSYPNWVNVKCQPAPDNWDYDCSYSYETADGTLSRESIGIKVDSRGVIERTAPSP